MQLSAVAIVVAVALSPGVVAQADEIPPTGAVETPPAESSAPPPPQGAVPAPVQSAAPAPVQGAVPAPPQATAPAPPPPKDAIETPSSHATVQPPPPSAVQSVAPEQAEAILGQRVTDAEGTDIGRLVDVLVDATGQPQAAVIDFGGFMGVGNRKIAVHWSVLHFNPGDQKHKVTLEMTPDQIKTAPEFLNPNKAAAVVTPANTTPNSP
ncbi:MAG: hypothetical protein QOF70_6815 [Acetobacteraceae bacterium]|jgi:hypothetical protein|nr:hypothetical protein [Rhodopila sp.]MEA2732340.1 hypothetical protein [Acetobacteraceae bacterium]